MNDNDVCDFICPFWNINDFEHVENEKIDLMRSINLMRSTFRIVKKKKGNELATGN